MENRQEFIALAERYCSMTLEEIQEAWDDTAFWTIKILTGFGTKETCTLCKAVTDVGFPNCQICEWHKLTGSLCNKNENMDTFIKIYVARDPYQLLTAVHARGAYMKTLIEKSHE